MDHHRHIQNLPSELLQTAPRGITGKEKYFTQSRRGLWFIAICFSVLSFLIGILFTTLLPGEWIIGIVLMFFCLLMGGAIYFILYMALKRAIRILTYGAAANAVVEDHYTYGRAYALEVTYTDKYNNQLRGRVVTTIFLAGKYKTQIQQATTLPLWYDEANTKKFVVILPGSGIAANGTAFRN